MSSRKPRVEVRQVFALHLNWKSEKVAPVIPATLDRTAAAVPVFASDGINSVIDQ